MNSARAALEMLRSGVASRQPAEAGEPVYACALCKDVGFTFTEKDGTRFAHTCECRRRAALESSLRRAGLPQRYAEVSFATYEYTVSHAARVGLQAAVRFADAWPLTEYKGLLLTGTVGTGKTHLAVAVLRTLVLQRGATGRFVDFGSLLRQLRSTYGDKGDVTEAEILQPVLACDVLALDEIGAEKSSDWTLGIIEHILGTRYNESRSTLITTNYAFAEPRGYDTHADDSRSAPLKMLRETLGDRVGIRMFSRLQDMTEIVEMNGPDYRARQRQRRSA